MLNRVLQHDSVSTTHAYNSPTTKELLDRSRDSSSHRFGPDTTTTKKLDLEGGQSQTAVAQKSRFVLRFVGNFAFLIATDNVSVIRMVIELVLCI